MTVLILLVFSIIILLIILRWKKKHTSSSSQNWYYMPNQVKNDVTDKSPIEADSKQNADSEDRMDVLINNAGYGSYSFFVADDGTIIRGQKNDPKPIHNNIIQSATEQKEALTLITESANAGYAEAQYFLGLCYERGSVVPKDLEMAKKWYRLAASQSFPLAKFRLGKIMMEEK